MLLLSLFCLESSHSYASMGHDISENFVVNVSLMVLIPNMSNLSNMRGLEILVQKYVLQNSHPIEQLRIASNGRFERFLGTQSSTYVSAYDKSLWRYGMVPSPGFEAWCEFAMLHNSSLIDEYEVVKASISPFWGLSGRAVLRSINDLSRDPSSDVWLCNPLE
jgi:hypothetical protein